MGVMKVGLVGLGHNGRALGHRLIKVGHRVIGYDSDLAIASRSGLRTVGSAARLHEECTVHIVAADGDDGCGLLEELLLMSSEPGATIIIAGAITPEEVHAFATAAAGKGIDLVDAPVVGGAESIEAGTAVVFAAGELAVVDRHRDVLSAFGQVLYVGEPGAGQVARTVNDLVYWANTVATYEAFTIARACDMDVSRIRDAVLKANGASQALKDWGREQVSEAEAETGAALALARALKVETPFLDQIDGVLSGITQDQLSGLFNLGIVDLSLGSAQLQPASEETQVTFAPDVELSEAEVPIGEEGLPMEELPVDLVAEPEQ